MNISDMMKNMMGYAAKIDGVIDISTAHTDRKTTAKKVLSRHIPMMQLMMGEIGCDDPKCDCQEKVIRDGIKSGDVPYKEFEIVPIKVSEMVDA